MMEKSSGQSKPASNTAIAKSSSPFVGRRAELKRLHETLQAVISSRKPKFILVQGDFLLGSQQVVRVIVSSSLHLGSSIIVTAISVI